MRKIVILVLSLLVIASLFSSACAKTEPAPTPSPVPTPTPTPTPPAPAEQTVFQWRVTCCEAQADNRYNSHARFCEQCREMSGGRLDFTLFAGGELYPAMEWYDAASKGTNEIALAYGGYVGGIDFGYALQNQVGPTPIRELGEAMIFYDRIMPLVQPRYAQDNIMTFGPFVCSEECFQSTVPIRKVSDFEGLKGRVGGTTMIRLFEKYGLTPVSIAMPEVYTALQLGTIDCLESSGYAGNYNTGLHEVAKYLIEPAPHASPGWQGAGIQCVNMDAWDSLPEDLQNILKGAFEAHSYYTYNRLLEEDLFARQLMIDSGCEVITLPPEEVKKIYDISWENLEELAQESELSAQIVDELKKVIDLVQTRSGFAAWR